MEIWKPIREYPIYEVSNFGRVKSKERLVLRKDGRTQITKEKILSPCAGKSGYLTVSLYRNKIRKTFTIHQLVAMAFLNHEPNGYKLVVDHIDNNKRNNLVDNLQLITHRENCSKDRPKDATGIHYSYGKYRVALQVNGYDKYVGRFKTLKIAKAVYKYEVENAS